MKIFVQKTLVNLSVLWLIVSASFFLIYLIPGDPVDFILKDEASLQDKIILRKEMGLDQPFLKQYVDFLKNLMQLNIGHSIYTKESVSLILWEHIPFTFSLALTSLVLAFFWGVPFGVLAAHPRFIKYDTVLDLLPILFFSVPAFVAAPLWIWFFGVYLMWLPVSGAEGVAYLVLPSLSLALPLGAVLMKITRTSILEVLPLDYVRTAKAKGVPPISVYFQHILKNAFIPVLTILGLQMGALLTGTVIIETIFDRPGLGSLLYQAILSRDYPIIQGTVLLIALIYVFINRGTDWLYRLVHPQMRLY